MLKTIKFLDKAVSIFLFIAACALVIFMIGQIIFIAGDLYHNFIEILNATSENRFSIINTLNVQYLHTVALMILLVKAYKILTSYADDHHVDIKYMIEIAVIGSILELLFNSAEYPPVMQVVFAILALGGALVYHYWYDFEGRRLIN